MKCNLPNFRPRGVFVGGTDWSHTFVISIHAERKREEEIWTLSG